MRFLRQGGGECGKDVTVHFEAESGFSGSFTGTML